MKTTAQSLPITVRPVLLTDAGALHAACWDTRPYDCVVDMLARVEKIVRQQRGIGLVAEYAGAVCAFGMLTIWPHAAEISDLIVAERYRGHGIGSRLIGELTHIAGQMGVRELEIGAALSNPRALALYRRLGFCDGQAIELDLGSGPELVQYLFKHLP